MNNDDEGKKSYGSIDPKFRILTVEEFQAISNDRKTRLEYVNAWANFGRYVLGINVMPASWQSAEAEDDELKFIPHGKWKEYQDNPIPEEIHQQWLKNGAFLNGIAGILGKIFHRPDLIEEGARYLSQIDMDNALAIAENIKWKGDKSLSEFGKRGLVTQHPAKPDSSAKVYVYSPTPLKNKDPDVPKDDPNLPSWEIHCLGRMAVLPGSPHRKGDPVIVIEDGNLGPLKLADEMEQRSFEEHSNNICIRYGLMPYLEGGRKNGNGNGSKGKGKGKSTSTINGNNEDRDRDSIPLPSKIVQMLSNEIGSCNEYVVINSGTRHKTILKLADFILFAYSDDEQFSDIQLLRDWFILINEHCCKPPLGASERDRIWNDAVEYVGLKKSLENKRILTVSEAIREQPGSNKTVRGTIFSVSTIFKVAIRLVYKCNSCGNAIKSPVKGIVLYWDTYLDSKCVNCEKEGQNLDFDQCKFNDAKIVVLQNVDLSSDLDETLEVMLLGEHTKDVKAGEIIVARGSLKYGPSNLGRHSKNKKTIALLTTKFVNYEGRQNVIITESDVKSFHRFAGLNQRKDVIERLVSMTAPNVIGEESYKLGILRSIVGGLDGQRRGRIHTLSVGDKGLAKSLVIREAIKMKPNARMITAQSASSTSALGIVDSTSDVKTLIYGPIPLSSGSIVGVDELQSWTHDNQGILLNVMEEGKFNLLKYARDKTIIAETTIIATVNPQDIDYENRSSISVKEINLLPPLRDRFDQVYVALDEIDEKKDWEYSGRRIEYTRKRKPHNYDFVRKYLLYAESITPILTPEAETMLRSFWIELRKQKLAGKRMLESIFRIAESTAKLRLKKIIDAEIALEVQESIRVIQTRLDQYVRTIQDPRDTAIEEIDKIVENIQSAVAFDEAVNVVNGESQYIRSWLMGGFNKELSSTHNRRFRELRDRYLQHIRQPGSKVLIVKISPLVVIWQTAKAATVKNDMNDMNDTNQILENSEKSEDPENMKKTKPETMSFASLVSFAKSKSNIEYEYLKETDSYRCPNCRCIYLVDTKDSPKAHVCNGIDKSGEVAN